MPCDSGIEDATQDPGGHEGGACRRQPRVRFGDIGELVRPCLPRGGAKDDVERTRRYREHVVAVADDEAARFTPDLDLAGLEQPAVPIAEDRQEDLIAASCLGRRPIDVEIAGVAAGESILEHVPPPGVFAPGDRHVVRYDVEKKAQAAGL